MMTGLLGSPSGSVTVGGVPIQDRRSRHLFGFAPDDLALPGVLTGREYLALYDRLRGRNDSPHSDLVEVFGLGCALDRQVEEYSHGMTRKLQIIAAIMHLPPLLILDEPYRGLDPDSVAALRYVIQSFAATDRTVLMATHDMVRAQLECDRVFILDRGRLVAEGEPNALILESGEAESLEDAFFLLTGRQQKTREDRMLISAAFGIDTTLEDRVECRSE